LQRPSITRRFFAVVAGASVCAAVVAGQGTSLPASDPLPAALGFRRAPEFLPIFTPRLHRDAYSAWVSTLAVEEVLRRLEPEPRLLHPPGAWQLSASLPVDAFGDAGTYDKSRLARTYGSTRVMVARGPVARSAAASESWALFSPYPVPTLDRLEPGTLLIVLTLR